MLINFHQLVGNYVQPGNNGATMREEFEARSNVSTEWCSSNSILIKLNRLVERSAILSDDVNASKKLAVRDASLIHHAGASVDSKMIPSVPV